MAGGRHGRSDAPSHHILYFAPIDISALATLRQRKQKEPLPGWVAAPKLNYMSIARVRLGLEGLLDGDSAGDGGTDHGVVAHADETHHVDVRRHGGRTGELGVGVHTAHGVGHAVRGRAGAHVVRVQGTASAATRSDGEVLLASLEALLLVGASNGVLEARRWSYR